MSTPTESMLNEAYHTYFKLLVFYNEFVKANLITGNVEYDNFAFLDCTTYEYSIYRNSYKNYIYELFGDKHTLRTVESAKRELLKRGVKKTDYITACNRLMQLSGLNKLAQINNEIERLSNILRTNTFVFEKI